MRVGEIVEMGFDFEDVYDLDGLYGASDISEAETIERQGYSQDDYEDREGDPAMRQVAVTEAYMKIDVDGTGIPVLHRFICGGTNYKLLDLEPWDDNRVRTALKIAQDRAQNLQLAQKLLWKIRMLAQQFFVAFLIMLR